MSLRSGMNVPLNDNNSSPSPPPAPSQATSSPAPLATTPAAPAVQWDLSLRAEQPIEGCELSPHPYLKIGNVAMDNSTKAKVRF